jgi:hypothetical protein
MLQCLSLNILMALNKWEDWGEAQEEEEGKDKNLFQQYSRPLELPLKYGIRRMSEFLISDLQTGNQHSYPTEARPLTTGFFCGIY